MKKTIAGYLVLFCTLMFLGCKKAAEQEANSQGFAAPSSPSDSTKDEKTIPPEPPEELLPEWDMSILRQHPVVLKYAENKSYIELGKGSGLLSMSQKGLRDALDMLAILAVEFETQGKWPKNIRFLDYALLQGDYLVFSRSFSADKNQRFMSNALKFNELANHYGKAGRLLQVQSTFQDFHQVEMLEVLLNFLPSFLDKNPDIQLIDLGRPPKFYSGSKGISMVIPLENNPDLVAQIEKTAELRLPILRRLKGVEVYGASALKDSFSGPSEFSAMLDFFNSIYDDLAGRLEPIVRSRFKKIVFRLVSNSSLQEVGFEWSPRNQAGSQVTDLEISIMEGLQEMELSEGLAQLAFAIDIYESLGTLPRLMSFKSIWESRPLLEMLWKHREKFKRFSSWHTIILRRDSRFWLSSVGLTLTMGGSPTEAEFLKAIEKP